MMATAKTIKVRIRISYDTKYGEYIVISGSIPELQDVNGKGVPMIFVPWKKWMYEADVPISTALSGITYKYGFVANNEPVLWEPGLRTLSLSPEDAVDSLAVFETLDVWKPVGDPTKILETSLFTDVIYKRKLNDASRKVVATSDVCDVWLRLQTIAVKVPPECQLCIVGSLPALGSWDVAGALSMSASKFPIWSADLLLNASEFPVEYKYVVVDQTRTNCVWESGYNRVITPDDLLVSLEKHPAVPTLASSLQATIIPSKITTTTTTTTTTSSTATTTGPTTAALAVPTTDTPADPTTDAPTDPPASTTPTPTPTPTPPKAAPAAAFSRLLIRSDPPVRSDDAWKGAGVAVPVFSLRSEHSFGVGDFLDIKPLVDFASKSGLCLIQLLPVNDTQCKMTIEDSSPYSGISVYALHPLYLRLSAIPNVPIQLQTAIDAKRVELNAVDHVDYPAVMAAKLAFARDIFRAVRASLDTDAGFTEFRDANLHWLLPYACFSTLRNITGSSEWAKWGKRENWSIGDMAQFFSEGNTAGSFHTDAILFHEFVQYHLHLQLREASLYAAEHRVGLKGDLPIGVTKYCVDTWVDRPNFRMQFQSGAPPDSFSKMGQNWQFPTYDWDYMAKDRYSWWRSRLTMLQQYFHSYRVDHVLGFFRIWELPESSDTGLLGRFRPATPITKHELEQRGVRDIRRLTEPYAKRGLVWNIFGNRTEDVLQLCFVHSGHDFYDFKPAFDTEMKIKTYCEGLPNRTDDDTKWSSWLQRGLYELVQNVCLIKDDQPDCYHPRIEMGTTSSYRELPDHVKQVLNDVTHDYFWIRQDTEWRKAALERLAVMQQASPMLMCGEDLGMIPRCVGPTLDELGVLGLRIQRMSPVQGETMADPSKYPYFTVCSTSSHDMSPLRLWWEKTPDRAKELYSLLGQTETGAPPAKLTSEVARLIIESHLKSPSALAIFPLQDLFTLLPEELWRPSAVEEQINDPENPANVWRYRMHLSLEQLNSLDTFTSSLHGLLAAAHRTDFLAIAKGAVA